MPGAHFLKDGVASFDAPFFNITAEEAIALEPRHRLLLKCAFEAFENGGIPMSSIAGRNVGVFVGVHCHTTSFIACKITKPRQDYNTLDAPTRSLQTDCHTFLTFEGQALLSILPAHQALLRCTLRARALEPAKLAKQLSEPPI